MTAYAFPDNEPKSKQLFERAQTVLPGGSTRHPVMYKPYVLYANNAAGCRITDVDGVERLDFVNNFSSQIHGHGHPAIVAAATNQIQRMTSSIMPTEAELQLAELLIERIPGIEQVRYGNSGTEAVMFAVKAARAYTGRSKLAKIEGGYHGQYDLVQHSFTSTPDNWGPEDNPNTVALDQGTPQETLDLLVTLSPNNIDASRTVIKKHASELAAVIVDPMAQRLGARPLTDEYLKMLREECDAHGIVLIFDEVISLRASYHGAQGFVGVIPDLTTVAKIIGGGFPIGALGGKREIMGMFDGSKGPARVFHGGTFTANPVSMVAGYTAMSLLTPEVFQELANRGDRLRAGVGEAGSAAGFPVQVMGVGSMSFVGLIDKPFNTYRESVMVMGPDYLARLAQFHRHMLNEGVLISPQAAFYGSTAMTDDDIDFAVEAVYRSLKQLASE